MGKLHRTFITILLIFATVFTSIGYASVSDNLSFFGQAEVTKPWYDLYISNITPDTSGGVDVTGYYSTYMSAEVGSSKTATFTVTVVNQSNKIYCYERIIEGEELGLDGVYTGDGIVPSVSGITFLSEVGPGESITFTFTVTNPGADFTDNYYIKFNFIEKTGTEILPGNDNYNITFRYNNGQPDFVVPVHKDEFVPRPEVPTRSGYDFTGWYTDITYTNAWNFEASRVTGDMTLYAGWVAQAPSSPSEYRVVFIPGNGDPDQTISVSAGSLIPVPISPTWDGYDFIGWYRDEACTDPWNFDTDILNSSITLYGGWETHIPPVRPERYITFKPNNGDPEYTIQVLTNDFIPRQVTPTMEGYSFIGWYTDEECTTAWNFDVNRVTSDMILYGGWDEYQDVGEVTHRVTFIPNNGTSNISVDVNDGGLVPIIEAPTKEGYIFVGWYKDAACTDPWNLDTDRIYSDMSLYAGWEVDEGDSDDDLHGNFMGLVQALISTSSNCMNNNDLIYNAVMESLTNKKRPKEDAPILHSSVNSVSGGTMSAIASYANTFVTDELQFIFEVDPDPAYQKSRVRLYMYYSTDIEKAKAGDEIIVYQQILSRGEDGVWFPDGTYVGVATVGNYFGGGNAGKDVFTINPYSWKYGAPLDWIP